MIASTSVLFIATLSLVSAASPHNRVHSFNATEPEKHLKGISTGEVANATSTEWTHSETPAVSSWKPASTGRRPLEFDIFSHQFVEYAVSIRSSNVAESVASSVAKHIIDDALSPPQFTSLANEGLQLWLDDGFHPDPTSLYKIATQASSAYDEIHRNIEYWSFVNYVRSATPLFNIPAAVASATAAYGKNSTIDDPLVNAFKNAISEQGPYFTAIFNSIVANPSGSAAVATFNSVAYNYCHDITGSQDSPNSVSIIEKFLSRVYATF